ncbi:hypothetical protein [Myxococcus phage Mx1]|nr:hypothetical protein [Myxococcus phage Mx1]
MVKTPKSGDKVWKYYINNKGFFVDEYEVIAVGHHTVFVAIMGKAAMECGLDTCYATKKEAAEAAFDIVDGRIKLFEEELRILKKTRQQISDTILEETG